MSPTTALSKIYTKEELCLMEKFPEPCGIVIFGASGDLTRRKLIPSLFKLFEENVLPPDCYIIGVGRTRLTDAAFQKGIEPELMNAPSAKTRAAFLKRFSYLSGDYADLNLYKSLDERMAALDQVHHVKGRHIFYFSTPPELYETIAERLRVSGLSLSRGKEGWVRIVVEKPFGRDLASAQNLNRAIREVFKEEQIYRIDHYLGKETVQNILMFRFANAIYEPIWNRKYIDHIQITAAETAGVEHRAGYYEQAGAVRDMFQNHLFQLLSMVAMEPPSSFDPEALRDERGKVLSALRPMGPPDISSAVRGQYAAGTLNGDPLPAYREEPGVQPNSTIETFAAMRVEVENWRWQGVPFYLRSGKRMSQRITEIVVQFKHVPASIFKPLMADQLAANILRLRIQPNEGISMCFEAKHPGPKICVSTVTMEFNYAEAFGTPPPEAYARLFMDVMLGDQTLFARSDWLFHSWRYLDPLLNLWAEEKGRGLHFYQSGSAGPSESDHLLNQAGRSWLSG